MKEYTTIVVEGPHGEYSWRGVKIPHEEVKKLITKAIKDWRRAHRAES